MDIEFGMSIETLAWDWEARFSKDWHEVGLPKVELNQCRMNPQKKNSFQL